MVAAAQEAGASAVKLQSLRAAALVSADCPAPAHVRVRSLREFFATFELDEAAHRLVAERAHEAGLAFLSTPFDERAVDMLATTGADALKIASGDLTHHALIACAAATGLPLILSTGMSSLQDVQAAVAVARRHGAHMISLLHCVSSYPVPAGAENLGAIRTLAAEFGVPVGLSDHGSDTFAAPVAVALGASLYERHLMLAGDTEAIDAAVSSSPAEFRSAIDAAARARTAIGSGLRVCAAVEVPNRRPSRRGIYAARAIGAGSLLQPADLVCLRPEHEVAADQWHALLGRRVVRDVAEGAPLTLASLAGGGAAS
jgi:sialic acid synthase SpsE